MNKGQSSLVYAIVYDSKGSKPRRAKESVIELELLMEWLSTENKMYTGDISFPGFYW